MLRDAAREVHDGKLTPQQGSALASISTALLKALESADLEVRVSYLEVRARKELDEPFRE